MGKDRFYRSNPPFTIGTIGSVNSGKTTLTAAISEVQATARMARAEQAQNMAKGTTIDTSHIEYATWCRHFVHIDCPGHADYIDNTIKGMAQMDAAILVVSVEEGPTAQTRQHIQLARQMGVKKILVFISKCDMIDDNEYWDYVELETRELLAEYSLPSEGDLVIKGCCALKALEGDDFHQREMFRLIEMINTEIHVERKIHDPFLLAIADVFSIPGQGTAVRGRVETGIIKVGEEVEIIGFKAKTKTICTGIEMCDKVLDEGRAGEMCQILLPGTKLEDIKRGQVLAKSGSINPWTTFESQVLHFFSKDEGGADTPFSKGYRAQFYFRTADVAGTIDLLESFENTDTAEPGGSAVVQVTLDVPIAMHEGLHYAIREGGRTVGAGTVSKVIV